MNDPTLVYKIAMTLIPNVGSITARQLIGYCGGVEAVFRASRRSLLRIPGIGPGIAAGIQDPEVMRQAERELGYLERNKVQALFYLDPEYPSRLKNFPDSPILLYFQGNADLETGRTVGFVGTRKPSMQGITICEELVSGLQPYQVTIASGLAYGIDITAHRQCLSCGIPTLGILGNGLSAIYPSAHRRTAREMTGQGGLLTEYTSETGPDREHFPMRNRIIAAFCDVLIVVETAKRGGSMITAEFANNYNKDVFAVPGRLKDECSKGCNFLIKTHKAALIETAEDVAYIMRWEQGDSPLSVQTKLFPDLGPDEKGVVDLLREVEVIGIDEISYRTGLSNSVLSAVLLELEFKGIVRSLPGKQFMLA